MLGLGRDQVQEPGHRLLAVDQALVHVDVEDVGAALDLLAGDGQRLLEVALLDQAGEPLRAGDVGPLADHDEVGLGADRPAAPCRCRSTSAGRSGPAAAATPSTASAIAAIQSGVVPQQPPTMLSQPLRANSPSDGRRVVLVAQEAAEAVGHAGVGIATDAGPADRRQALDRVAHQVDADRAVEPDGEGVEVRDRVVKRLDRLGRERAAVVEDRPRDHHRQPRAGLLEELVDGEQARLHDQRVERRSRAAGCRPRRRPGRGSARCSWRPSRRRSTSRRPGSSTWMPIESCFLVGPMLPATNRGLSGVLPGELVRRAPGQLGGRLVQLEDVFLAGRTPRATARCR